MLEGSSTAPSPQGNDFLPPVILAEKTFVHLLHHIGQHRAGIVGKVQVPDLRHGHGDDGERFFVFFGGTRAQLGRNREAVSQRQGSTKCPCIHPAGTRGPVCPHWKDWDGLKVTGGGCGLAAHCPLGSSRSLGEGWGAPGQSGVGRRKEPGGKSVDGSRAWGRTMRRMGLSSSMSMGT